MAADDRHLEDLRPYSPPPQPLSADYDPDDSWMPYLPDEHRAALFAAPTPVLIGGHVMYRHELHGDVTDAVVLDIDYDSEPRAIIDGLVVDLPPWPTLTLDTLHGPVRTREARTRGSAGWLPLNWVETVRRVVPV